ncbi:hypothetical protein [Undibacterium pigrum]|uniref:hypothetical protein n=1 Tax=Undibacterium pigrum TaxID=401470 RepID=UPI0011B79E06|nr:hypothetical protein [Undibacterium pigrum]
MTISGMGGTRANEIGVTDSSIDNSVSVGAVLQICLVVSMFYWLWWNDKNLATRTLKCLQRDGKQSANLIQMAHYSILQVANWNTVQKMTAVALAIAGS